MFAIKKQTIVARSKEMGMVAPAANAITGRVNTILMAGAMWVMP